jgi:hypothetical protein
MHNKLEEWNKAIQFSRRSREWWTYDRQKYRSPFGEDGIPVPVSHRLSDHASADEIANAIAGTAKLWRDMGEQVKAANRASPLPKFTIGALYALPREQQQQVLDGECLKDHRSNVRQVLRELKDDSIPSSFHPRKPYFTGELGRLLTEIYDRYWTAFRAVLQRHEDEWKPRPVDDAAWEETLRQRARNLAYQVAETQIRQKRGRPSYVDHELIKKRAAQLQAAYGEQFHGSGADAGRLSMRALPSRRRPQCLLPRRRTHP